MAERLKLLLDTLEISIREFAREIGTGNATLSHVLAGRSKSLSGPILAAIHERYGVSLEWLLTGKGDMFVPGMSAPLAKMGAVPSKEHLLPTIRLRYYPNGVPASPFNVADDSYEIMELPKTEGLHEECILARVRGPSLSEAGILNGDLLIVDTRLRTPSDGDLVIAAVGDESTVKFWRVEGDRVWLQPASSTCEPIEVTGNRDLRIVGTVTEIRRAMWKPARPKNGLN